MFGSLFHRRSRKRGRTMAWLKSSLRASLHMARTAKRFGGAIDELAPKGVLWKRFGGRLHKAPARGRSGGSPGCDPKSGSKGGQNSASKQALQARIPLEFATSLADIGQSRHQLCEIRPKLANFGQISTDLGKVRPQFVHKRHFFVEVG